MEVRDEDVWHLHLHGREVPAPSCSFPNTIRSLSRSANAWIEWKSFLKTETPVGCG